jgi:tartrate-resistant acid phosphatase type 5
VDGRDFLLESRVRQGEHEAMLKAHPLNLLLAAAVCAVAPPARADQAAGPSASPIEEIASRLPPAVGDAARKWLHEDERELKAARAFSPADLEREVMVDLAREPAAAQFVVAQMANEPAKTDKLILKVLVIDSFWEGEPGLTEGLRRLAETTTDPDLMLAYLDAEHRMEVKRARKLLADRIADARKAGDARTLQELANADERWIMIERGASMPGYLRVPPPVFSVKPADQAVRVVGMGDFGSGSEGQREVAAAIVRMGREQPFDIGLTFGDNFYPSGMNSPTDTRWRDWWESLYSPLGIVFYPTLGNHEWYSDDGAVS